MKREDKPPQTNVSDDDISASATSLDADLARAIDRASAPVIASQPTIDRVRTQLLTGIAEQSIDAHTTVHVHENTWQPFIDRIEFKLLNHANGVASYLLRLQPGAVLPAHRHPMDEECVVLAGELQIGERLRLKAGGFHLARKELPHANITTADGALIFLRGALPSRKHALAHVESP